MVRAPSEFRFRINSRPKKACTLTTTYKVEGWSYHPAPTFLVTPLNTFSAAEQRATLAEIEAKIIRCKDYLADLEQEQREVEGILALVVYPVLTLPNEITAHIFVACLPDEARVVPSPDSAPLLLAQICRHWREIALSICQLWRSVQLDIPARSERDRARFLLDSWRSRAKGYSLSLGLHSVQQSAAELPPEILAYVSAVSGQIKSLLITLPALRQIHLICTHLEGNTPLADALLANLLTNLEIHGNISMVTFFRVLDDFPLLMHVKCNIHSEVAPFSRAPERFTVCLNERHVLPQLRHITITSMSTEIDYELLVDVLRWRRDSIQQVRLQAFQLNFDSIYWSEGEGVRVWLPGNLAFPELEDLVKDGLDFVVTFEEICGRVGEYWPNNSFGQTVLAPDRRRS
ncbi:hypothetical protein C8R44DRAFT_938365 [Mycena epipterygia]|nr:hypothetical protein C8R44DRAFT_938365 [Mycena epipterygia]